jgi:hypothetical protein
MNTTKKHIRKWKSGWYQTKRTTEITDAKYLREAAKMIPIWKRITHVKDVMSKWPKPIQQEMLNLFVESVCGGKPVPSRQGKRRWNWLRSFSKR